MKFYIAVNDCKIYKENLQNQADSERYHLEPVQDPRSMSFIIRIKSGLGDGVVVDWQR